MQGLFALAHPPVIAGHSASKTRVNALMTRQSILFAKRTSCEADETPGSSPGVTRLGCAMANHVNRNMLLESLPTKDGRGVGKRLRIMFWEA
jgi:hypothetical protein